MERINLQQIPASMNPEQWKRFLKWRYQYIPTQLWRLKNKELIRAKRK